MAFHLKLVSVPSKSPSEVLERAQTVAFKNIQQNLTQFYEGFQDQSSESNINKYMENLHVTIEADGVLMSIDGWKPAIHTINSVYREQTANPIENIKHNSDNLIDAAFKSAFDGEG